MKKAKFKVGQVVHCTDWKGATRLGKVVQVTRYDDGEISYMVEWSLTERLCAGDGSGKYIKALTKRECGKA